MIDDVNFSETPDNELSFSDETFGGWWLGYQVTGDLGTDFTMYPMSQAAANPYRLEGVVRNSIYKPDQISAEAFEAGPDGYLWKFLYNVGVYNARRYLTSEWIPVERISDSTEGGPQYGSLSAARLAQLINQEVAVTGQVVGIRVENLSELDSKLEEAFALKDRLVFVDVMVDPEEHVYPMAIKGGAMKDMILSKTERT